MTEDIRGELSASRCKNNTAAPLLTPASCFVWEARQRHARGWGRRGGLFPPTTQEDGDRHPVSKTGMGFSCGNDGIYGCGEVDRTSGVPATPVGGDQLPPGGTYMAPSAERLNLDFEYGRDPRVARSSPTSFSAPPRLGHACACLKIENEKKNNTLIKNWSWGTRWALSVQRTTGDLPVVTRRPMLGAEKT